MNTNMLPVFAYLFNWHTPFVERHARKRVLFREGVDDTVRLETPEKDVRLSGPYARTKISHQLGAWDIRIQLERSDEDVPSQSGNV